MQRHPPRFRPLPCPPRCNRQLQLRPQRAAAKVSGWRNTRQCARHRRSGAARCMSKCASGRYSPPGLADRDRDRITAIPITAIPISLGAATDGLIRLGASACAANLHFYLLVLDCLLNVGSRPSVWRWECILKAQNEPLDNCESTCNMTMPQGDHKVTFQFAVN